MDAPRRLGDYEVLAEVATGGVATVLVARHAGDAGFERLVAIKRVHRHLLREPDVFASLADEARLSALVRHPNVVATNEVLDQKGELLLVQEYVEGVSLALLHKRALQRGRATSKGRLPTDAVARIAVDFLRGLHAAHEAVDLRGAPLELVHRDVSPQNVLVGVDGVARLIDFGIARAEGRLAETRGGILKGKLAYMAPEQVGEREVDRRADVFAAGVVIYELLAAVRPFDGAGDAESMARILAADVDIAPVTERAGELAPIVARALAREPGARWPTAEAFAEAIADAVRPAGDGAMRALVADLAGDIVEERRASIREELGRADDEALARDEASALASSPAPAVRDAPSAAVASSASTPTISTVTRPEPASRPSRAPWYALGGVVVAALGARFVLGAGAVSPGPGEPVAPAVSSGVVPVGVSTAPVDSAPPLRSGAPASVSAVAPRPSVGGPRARPSNAHSAAPSASPPPSASSELHRNPYGK